MGNELQMINDRLARMETNQQEIKAEQQGMKEEQQEMKKEQQGMKIGLQPVRQAVLETNEVVKRMEKDQIIELLSSRSVEQEAEIKRIK